MNDQEINFQQQISERKHEIKWRTRRVLSAMRKKSVTKNLYGSVHLHADTKHHEDLHVYTLSQLKWLIGNIEKLLALLEEGELS